MEGIATAYLDRVVGAYIDEVRKPFKPTTWDLEWIGIDREALFTAHVSTGIEETVRILQPGSTVIGAPLTDLI